MSKLKPFDLRLNEHHPRESLTLVRALGMYIAILKQMPLDTMSAKEVERLWQDVANCENIVARVVRLVK